MSLDAGSGRRMRGSRPIAAITVSPIGAVMLVLPIICPNSRSLLGAGRAVAVH